MHDPIHLGPALPGALTTAEIDRTTEFAANEKSAATRAAYESDWRDFAAWCAGKGTTPLPAHVGIVAAYLSALADSGRKSSTIGRRAAAIGYRHKLAGHEPPGIPLILGAASIPVWLWLWFSGPPRPKAGE